MLEESNYVIDAEQIAEVSRLDEQARMIAKVMGGLLPERGNDLSGMQQVLDLACGPGKWAMDVAGAAPYVQVTGVDISQTMLLYAQQHKGTLQNVYFRHMNILESLAFPDASFDLVNARLLVGVVKREQWTPLLAESLRVLRPGGILRLSEMTVGQSTSPAYEEFARLLALAFLRGGYSFLPLPRDLGITMMLAPLLRRAGCDPVRLHLYPVDYSADTELVESFRVHIIHTASLAKPFLLKTGVTTEEEYLHLLTRLKVEINQPDFCALAEIVTAIGIKPR